MEIIRSDKGKNKGGISVARTLATMSKNERWETSTTEVDPDYVRAACAKFSRTTGREFSVSHTLDMGTQIIVTRNA